MISIDPPCAGTAAQPVYVMIKPPAPVAIAIDGQRSRLGIDRCYGRDRFHVTLLPVCDGRDLSQAVLERLDRAVASLHAEPLRVAFDRLKRNALVGGGALRDLRGLQRRLVRCLTAQGVTPPGYTFRPHVSLAYGRTPDRTVSIAPIGWQVSELLLIRSHHGEGRHEALRRWPLAVRQWSFRFD